MRREPWKGDGRSAGSPIQRGFRRPSGASIDSSVFPGFRFAAVAAALHPGLRSAVPSGLNQDLERHAECRDRNELDDPEGAEKVHWEIGDLLDQWESKPDCETEDDFTQDLADYLEDYTDWEIEVYPSACEGKPDILIGDLLAPELKRNPSKGELDRCIGQCAAHSRQWITWMVIIDASASEIGRLQDLLQDKGLDHIELWSFS